MNGSQLLPLSLRGVSPRPGQVSGSGSSSLPMTAHDDLNGLLSPDGTDELKKQVCNELARTIRLDKVTRGRSGYLSNLLAEANSPNLSQKIESALTLVESTDRDVLIAVKECVDAGQWEEEVMKTLEGYVDTIIKNGEDESQLREDLESLSDYY
jgi:hypothetical protein